MRATLLKLLTLERIRSAVNLGTGVNDAHFREAAEVATERKKVDGKQGNRKRK